MEGEVSSERTDLLQVVESRSIEGVAGRSQHKVTSFMHTTEFMKEVYWGRGKQKSERVTPPFLYRDDWQNIVKVP